MDLRKLLDDVDEAADAMFCRIEREAKARYASDDISRLSFEIGYLRATIRQLMIDLELNRQE